MDKKLQLIFFISFFLISCDDLNMSNQEKTNFTDISYEDKKTIVGSIPSKFIHYGPRFVSEEQDNIEAIVAFDSDDIDDYSGRYFSVRVFLKYYKNDIEKNDAGRYLIETRSNWQSSYKKLPPYQSVIGTEGSYIGKNELQIIVYKSTSPNKDISDSEYILINNSDVVLFDQLYPPNESKNLYGIYEYKTSILERCAATFQLKIHSFEKFSHKQYFYAKKFIEEFYR